MADNYYSMQEVMGKLRKAEAEVQDLVKQGKLRQYMDAGNAVFKVEDVDSLSEEIVGLDLSSAGISLDGGSELDLELEETAEVPLEADMLEEIQEDLPQADAVAEADIFDDTLGIMPEAEEVADVAELIDDTMGIVPDAEEVPEAPAVADETLALELEPDDAPEAPEAPGAPEAPEAPALVDETIGLEIEPDEKAPADDPELELDIEGFKKESEGGFGLSQMGDLTMADTNVGTVGINILSGTEDAFRLTDDTKAETQSADASEMDELESLDADANMESFGSGSGLLDLSLQADDTSLGAVLDDILPAGAEDGGDLPVAGGLMDEEDLLADSAPAAGDADIGAAVTAPMGPATTTAPLPGAQMVAAAVVDPKTNIYGVAMFLPLAAMILAGIVMTAAVRDVVPSLLKTLVDSAPANIALIWYVAGGMAVLVLVILAFAAMLGGGGGGGGTKVKKEKKPKKEKVKKKKRK